MIIAKKAVCYTFYVKTSLLHLKCYPQAVIQWSAVTVTAVTVTVSYSDSFGNPRFITNKTPLLTVIQNWLE